LYLPTDTTPEELFQAIGRLRKEARDEIDRLIRFLDKTDDYVSRELEDQVDDGPCDDNELEPSLCGVTVAQKNMVGDGNGRDLELDASDHEPSLGSCNTTHGQTQESWGRGGTDEREGPDDDLEPSLSGVTVEAGDDRDLEGDDADREPSLGWPEDRVSQAARPGNFDDRELAGEAGRRVVEGRARSRADTLHRRSFGQPCR
jgi:hypothetical protein